MTKHLSTPARNALLQLYRLGFLWINLSNTDERKTANELLKADCAIRVENSNKAMTIMDTTTGETTYTGYQRIEITLRGIQQAVTIYEDEQRAIRQLQRRSALGKVKH